MMEVTPRANKWVKVIIKAADEIPQVSFGMAMVTVKDRQYIAFDVVSK